MEGKVYHKNPGNEIGNRRFREKIVKIAIEAVSVFTRSTLGRMSGQPQAVCMSIGTGFDGALDGIKITAKERCNGNDFRVFRSRGSFGSRP